jgi:hypothetical protein
MIGDRLTATHEAGHAVIAMVEGVAVRSATIVACVANGRSYAGTVDIGPAAPLQRLRVDVAGAVAERLDSDDVDAALRRGELSGGIVPKLEAALAAARAGIETHVGTTHVFA